MLPQELFDLANENRQFLPESVPAGPPSLPRELELLIFKAALVETEPISIFDRPSSRHTRMPIDLPHLTQLSSLARATYLTDNTFVVDIRDGRDERGLMTWLKRVGEPYLPFLRSLVLRGVTYDLTGDIIVELRVEFPSQKVEAGSQSPVKVTPSLFYPKVPSLSLYYFAGQLGYPLPVAANEHILTAGPLAMSTVCSTLNSALQRQSGLNKRSLSLAATRFRIALEHPLVVRVGDDNFAVPAAYARKMKLI